MPNSIKYTTGTESQALKKGNFAIGTGDVGKGPSEETGYYNGVQPPVGGWLVYLNRPGTPGNLEYQRLLNDNELINYTNKISGENYTIVNQCLDYFVNQSDIIVIGQDSEPLLTDGLVLYLNAGLILSYPKSGDIWYDLSGKGNNGTLTNGLTFDNNNGGSIVFNGVDDFITTGQQLDPIARGLFADSTSFWSVSSWFLPDTTNVNIGVITGKSGDTGTNTTYAVWQEGTALKVRLRGGDILYITTSLSSVWNEVIITWDGSVGRAYLNGQFINTISIGTANKQTNNFVIGATNNGAINRYKGNIKDTKIYNRCLSNTDIFKNYAASLYSFFESKVRQDVGFFAGNDAINNQSEVTKSASLNPLLQFLPNAGKSSKVYSVLPIYSSGDFTFSRNGTATYFDKDGFLKIADLNEPRLSFDPHTGKYEGILIESAGTNILTWSENFLNSPWRVDTNGVRTIENIVTPLGTIGPVVKFTKTAAINTVSSIGRSISSTADKLYFSIFIKQINVNKWTGRQSGFAVSNFINFNFDNFNPIDGPEDFIFSMNWKRLPNDWYWAEWGFINIFNDGAAHNMDIINFFNNSAGAEIYLWGAQVVENHPSSYISTTTSQVTRPADIISVTGSSLFGQTQGSVLFSFETLEVTSLTLGNLVFYTNGYSKIVFTYSNNEQKLYQNGSLVGSAVGSFSYNNLSSLSLLSSNNFDPVFVKEYSTFGYILDEQACINLTTI